MSFRSEQTTQAPAPSQTMGKHPAYAWMTGFFVLLILVVWALSWSDRTAKPMPPNGDVLGPEAGESAEAYEYRVHESLETALRDWPEESSWAMIAFQEPVDAMTAGEVTADILRVSAAVSNGEAPVVLPEPVAGTSRRDVFERVGMGHVESPISALIVWDRPRALRAVAERQSVLSVEILPPDAQWGRFGVRPPAWNGS